MGGKKKCFINLYFQSTLQTCNLNTFVLENDFEYSPFLLTKLEHDSIIFSSFLLAYTFDVLDHIHQHNQPNTIRYLLCGIHYTLCIIYYALFSMYYALYTMHYTLSIITMHYTLYIIYYTLCTMHYTLCTMHYALYTIHYSYVFIRIHTYLLFYLYLYVFTISRGNPAKSRDFGTHV